MTGRGRVRSGSVPKPFPVPGDREGRRQDLCTGACGGSRCPGSEALLSLAEPNVRGEACSEPSVFCIPPVAQPVSHRK